MAQDSSVSISPDTALRFHPGKGLAAKFSFATNPYAFLPKHTAAKCIQFLAEEDAERLIGFQVDPGFKSEVLKNEMTLVQVIQIAAHLMDEFQSVPTAIDSPERFVTPLTQIAPNETGAQLLARLKELVEGIGEDTALLADKLFEKNGRDDDGYIRLRKAPKDSKKEVAQ